MSIPCSNIGRRGKLLERSLFASRMGLTVLGSVKVHLLEAMALVMLRMERKRALMRPEVVRHRKVTVNSEEMARDHQNLL